MAKLIKNKSFNPEYLEGEREKPDVLTLRLNKQERRELEVCKEILEQSKDSTAIKQLAELGKIVLHDHLTGRVINTLFKNKRNNSRLGIADFD